MLDFSHIPTQYGAATVESFTGNSVSSGIAWQMWQKPRGKTMAHILLVGAGGPGGSGAIGANSTAAGGGGGASGGQGSIMVPLWAIPDVLFLSLGYGLTNGAVNSYVSIAPNTVANNSLLYAGGGGAGGNASGATAGAAGSAGGAPSTGTMPLGWQWLDSAISGQAGIIGGVAVSGANLTLPTSGLLVTGGTGGGGLPAAATSGTAGGSFTVAGVFPAHAGGAAQATATNPANDGSHGYRPVAGSLYGYGGTGGGSTHGTATGGGLVASRGGNGAPGCGGGGGGGALTGSAAGSGGLGGPAFCIITCW